MCMDDFQEGDGRFILSLGHLNEESLWTGDPQILENQESEVQDGKVLDWNFLVISQGLWVFSHPHTEG